MAAMLNATSVEHWTMRHACPGCAEWTDTHEAWREHRFSAHADYVEYDECGALCPGWRRAMAPPSLDDLTLDELGELIVLVWATIADHGDLRVPEGLRGRRYPTNARARRGLAKLILRFEHLERP